MLEPTKDAKTETNLRNITIFFYAHLYFMFILYILIYYIYIYVTNVTMTFIYYIHIYL